MKRLCKLSFRYWLMASLLFAGQGSYIWVKALVAQVLLRHAWAATTADNMNKPWPWATVVPVGRLLVPTRKVDLVVLSGSDGSALAFGPGHHSESAKLGESGNVVIAAHRDTHFAFLQFLHNGETIYLESPDRVRAAYQVQSAQVVHKSERDWLAQRGENALTMISCYPFDAPTPGGPLRYIVRAIRQRNRGGVSARLGAPWRIFSSSTTTATFAKSFGLPSSRPGTRSRRPPTAVTPSPSFDNGRPTWWSSTC